MRINISKTDALGDALESVNRRAAAHVLEWYNVTALAERVEKDLQGRGVPKKYLKGARVTYTPAGPGKSYARKGRFVVSTQVELERGASDWFLIGAEKVDVWATESERFTMRVTDAARQAIEDHAFRNIAV